MVRLEDDKCSKVCLKENNLEEFAKKVNKLFVRHWFGDSMTICVCLSTFLNPILGGPLIQLILGGRG